MALANRNCRTPKNTAPMAPMISSSRGPGQRRTMAKAIGVKIRAAPALRKNAMVTGSVSVTKNRMATNDEPPNEVDRQAASAAQTARRPVRATMSSVVMGAREEL